MYVPIYVCLYECVSLFNLGQTIIKFEAHLSHLTMYDDSFYVIIYF